MGDAEAAVSDAWTQRVGAFSALPALIRELGQDPRAAIERAGLAADALDESEHRVSFRAIGALLGDVAERSGCLHVGLLAGRLWHFDDLSIVGVLCRHSPTVGDALHALVVHQHLNSEGGAAFLLERGEWVDLGYAIYCPDVDGANQLCEAMIGGGVNFLRELCGSGWHPTEIRFAHHAPADVSPHRAFFRITPHFDADYCAIRFPAAWMRRRVSGADPEALREARVQAAAAGHAQFLQGVYRALRVGLVSGRASGDDVARALSMHRRTLNRRLEAEGTTFQAMLDQVRFVTARQLLAGSRLPLDDVAAALGYSGVTQFMRRFRVWTGASPAAWRRVRATSSPRRGSWSSPM